MPANPASTRADVEHYVLHSVHKHSRNKDRLDYRSISDIANALLLPWSDVSRAVSDLLDTGELAQAEGRGGAGYRVIVPRPWGHPGDFADLVGHSEKGGLTASPGPDDDSDWVSRVPREQIIRSANHKLEPQGARLELEGEWRGLPGRRIGQRKRSSQPPADPDTPWGLVAYFDQHFKEAALPWPTNRGALLAAFRAWLAGGLSAEDIRRMIDAVEVEDVRSAQLSAWRYLLARRMELMHKVARTRIGRNDDPSIEWV
jgi:hypothetical protein